MRLKSSICLIFLLVLFQFLQAQTEYPGNIPGEASLDFSDGKKAILENDVVRAEFSFNEKSIRLTGFEDKKSGDRLIVIPLPLFELKMVDGRLISSDKFKIVSNPIASDIKGNLASHFFAEKSDGKKFEADLKEKNTGINVHWEAELRNGSNYIRQIFRFKTASPDKVIRIELIKIPSESGVQKVGTVDGSPLVLKNMFIALEYPLATIENENNFTSVSVPRLTNELSTVWGVTPAGQLRRGFLYYVERERAHPYHQVLHYNSWFDISWHNRKFSEAESLDRIKMFGDSLINARRVKMAGFLFDDGWDDNRTLWKFHSGFPDGFANLKTLAQSYRSDIGVWMSPFGGYGESKNLRIEYGNKQNPPFETNANGFSLSGPVYYNRFKEVTYDFIKNYNICMFKFDGVGAGIGAGNGDQTVYQRDVEAFLTLLDDMLKLKPDLYLSLTTGTWPSVYWLMHGDNIWRGGDDTNMMGEGSKRQQWITYRDADTYKNIVQRGPLFPLNSLMLCGICIADNGNPELFEMNDNDISDEIWSFFATGTNLQELYINPHKLSKANWDCLASAAQWAKENEAVMSDVHWVGGNPAKGEVYGFAAWSSEKAVLSLRNPSSTDKIFRFNVKDVFDLPADVGDNYQFTEIKSGSEKKNLASADGRSFLIIMKPFEVKVFNALHAK